MKRMGECAKLAWRPKALDVFAGCGGTTLGLRGAGFLVAGAIECDPLAARIYRLNHPDTVVWECDVRSICGSHVLSTLSLLPGELDLLVGCPPCQAFSAIRRLNGRRKIRDRTGKDLIFEYLRLAETLRPKVLLVENVPHLMDDYRFSEVQSRLRALGYVGEPRVFDAAHFSVPQRRKRMILIASRIGEIEYATVSKRNRLRTVRDTISRLPPPGDSGDVLHDLIETRSPRIQSLIEMIPRDGGSRSHLGADSQLRCHRKCDGFKDVYGRMAWDSVAPTITGGCVNPSKGRFLHPEQHRAITLREAALLQGFPHHYRFTLDGGKYAVAQLIGNAFPPAFVRAHAVRIRRHITNFNGQMVH